MILKIVDGPPEEGFTLTREVWLRNGKHVVLPDEFLQETVFVLSELKTNRLYLSEHRDNIVPSIRQNMGLSRETFERFERAYRVVLGLVLIVAALSQGAFFAVLLGRLKANSYDVYLCGAESLMAVSMLIFLAKRAMRGTLQPSYTKQVDENVEDLITKGRLIICEAQVAFFSMSPSLCYTLFPEHGRAIRMEVAFPEYQYIKFPGNKRRFNILVLYVNSELNVVL